MSNIFASITGGAKFNKKKHGETMNVFAVKCKKCFLYYISNHIDLPNHSVFY